MARPSTSALSTAVGASQGLLRNTSMTPTSRKSGRRQSNLGFHCEIQRIQYLENERIPVMGNMVGVQQIHVPFRAASICAKSIASRRPEGGGFRGVRTHTLLHGLFPHDDSRGDTVVQTIREKVGKELRYLAGQGSETSGGSTSGDDEDRFITKMTAERFGEWT